MKRVGHWSKSPKGEFFDESHTLRTYWDEEKYCIRCGNCHTEVREGTVCNCAKKNK